MVTALLVQGSMLTVGLQNNSKKKIPTASVVMVSSYILWSNSHSKPACRLKM